jgi:hypothetical protein
LGRCPQTPTGGAGGGPHPVAPPTPTRQGGPGTTGAYRSWGSDPLPLSPSALLPHVLGDLGATVGEQVGCYGPPSSTPGTSILNFSPGFVDLVVDEFMARVRNVDDFLKFFCVCS